nr:isoform 3 of tetraspanin-19 [Quercus suber]
MLLLFLLLLLEAGVTADVFLNRNWEEDFPVDPSGNFAQLKDFVRSNFEIWTVSIIGNDSQSSWATSILGP